MHYTNSSAAVYKLDDYTDELANHHEINEYGDEDVTVQGLRDIWTEIVGE